MVMDIISQLMDSAGTEPAIRWKLRVSVLGEDPASLIDLQEEIRQSQRVRNLLSELTASGITRPKGIYSKWQGAHWVMAALADIGYPPGDSTLAPVRDQLLDFWLADNFYTEFEANTRAAAYRGRGVPVLQGRHRRCASQQSNALWSILKLGLVNEDTHQFVERLLHWQWPDGGWNCDKNPEACHSSFMESILPLRALAAYADEFADSKARQAADRAADIFLKRELYLGQTSGKPIKREFIKLHYPLYWHYDVLHGLKVMAEAGYINDSRCNPALDLLEEKQLPAGGWPAEAKYYDAKKELVDWGGSSTRKLNPWITADALYVLKTAGRISP